jgi:preprotein translocase subunit SecG
LTLLIIFHILVCTFLVFVILLQPGKADAGIGFGSSSQSIFGSKGAGNFLTKTTSICAVIFIFTSFVLTRARIREYDSSVIKATPAAPTAPADASKPADNKPAAPGAAATPTTPEGKTAAPTTPPAASTPKAEASKTAPPAKKAAKP